MCWIYLVISQISVDSVQWVKKSWKIVENSRVPTESNSPISRISTGYQPDIKAFCTPDESSPLGQGFSCRGRDDGDAGRCLTKLQLLPAFHTVEYGQCSLCRTTLWWRRYSSQTTRIFISEEGLRNSCLAEGEGELMMEEELLFSGWKIEEDEEN